MFPPVTRVLPPTSTNPESDELREASFCEKSQHAWGKGNEVGADCVFVDCQQVGQSGLGAMIDKRRASLARELADKTLAYSF